MFDSLHLLLIFMLPLLLSGLKTFHLGLVTGLFLSLLYWGVLFPPLVLIPLSAAVVLGFRQRQLPADFAAPTSDMLYIRKPAQRLFMAFLVFMVIFCALGDTVYLYGTYIKASGAALRASDFLGTLGLFAGPVSAGIYCDRKGPFKTAVALTFIAELGTGFAAFGGNDFRLWLTGCFLLSAVISGFLPLFL